ncbi:AASDHPPT family protein [Megaselia abdita]
MSEIVRWAVNFKNFRPSKEELVKAVSCVQSEEKDRLIKFHFLDDFYSSLIGRLLQRKFVNEFGSLGYSDIHFSRDEKGKPIVNNKLNSHIKFNVSHQGDYTVLAGFVADKCQSGIGVDIMKIDYKGGKSIPEFFRLMTKHFSIVEWSNIRKHLKEREQLKSFMRHWCLKESYVKNIGVGITVDLQKISFEIHEDQLMTSNIVESTKLKVNGVSMVNWRFEEHLIDEDHCVAIALSDVQNCATGPFRFFNSEELLENSRQVTEFDEQYCEQVFTKAFKKL